jgi:hypothetical protein
LPSDAQYDDALARQSEGGGQAYLDAHDVASAALGSSVSNGVGQMTLDAQEGVALPAPPSGVGEGHHAPDPQYRVALADTILSIKEAHRLRVDYHRAEKALTLRGKAQARRFCNGDKAQANAMFALVEKAHKAALKSDPSLGVPECTLYALATLRGEPPIASFIPAIMPIIHARHTMNAFRIVQEKQLERLAKKLPVWPWAEEIRGFAALGLAQIIGEAGDLSMYANPGKLWKRLGLAVFAGRCQRRVSDKDEAIRQGYSPSRRSIVYCVGDCLIKAGNAYYKQLYSERKAYEMARLPKGEVNEHKQKGRPALWHARAKRYMEKRLIKHLWQAWNRQEIED